MCRTNECWASWCFHGGEVSGEGERKINVVAFCYQAFTSTCLYYPTRPNPRSGRNGCRKGCREGCRKGWLIIDGRPGGCDSLRIRKSLLTDKSHDPFGILDEFNMPGFLTSYLCVERFQTLHVIANADHFSHWFLRHFWVSGEVTKLGIGKCRFCNDSAIVALQLRL